ncbi:uncharacterized protein SAPINGB_P003479 [Magnusiomyces paraingens]|uniref:Ribosomal protein L9 domain-containing protein n=1 Tax=Magnusiomyces paraingens TaxID=2606893 RepID=A0A5E8BQG2_9ASCO|nr:uncharacterized protein SAPINGB_P003479 [Saprochaete ingens]VVT53251.1 unnamed protein product [Saprochaete ingens]
MIKANAFQMATRRSFSSSAAVMRGAADKRIPVQLLKDFPGLGFRGEIVKVLPGRMRNQLHRNNGAAYVLRGEELRIPLVKRETIQAAIDAEKAAQKEAEQKVWEEKQLELQKRANTRKNSREDLLNALESLGDLNIAFPTLAQKPNEPQQQAQEPASQAQEETEIIPDSTEKAQVTSLYFLETTLKSLPKVITISAEANGQGFLRAPLTISRIASHISGLLGVDIDPASITLPIAARTSQRLQSEKNQTENQSEQAAAIDFVGSHPLTFVLSNGRTISNILRVAPSNINAYKSLANWQTLTRPANTPILDKSSVTSAESKKATEPTGEKKPKTEEGKQHATKSFEWENDLLNKISR